MQMQVLNKFIKYNCGILLEIQVSCIRSAAAHVNTVNNSVYMWSFPGIMLEFYDFIILTYSPIGAKILNDVKWKHLKRQ
jgi:hypothetical protein